MKTLAAFVVAASLVAPLAAQPRRVAVPGDEPAISLRPFFLITAERLSASNTFDAIFGSSIQPLWGGGLNLAFRSGLYIDVAASRFKKTGERAFFFDGQSFGLGLPVTATMTPLEVTVGRRFLGVSPRVVPYVGIGTGFYSYREQSPVVDDDVDQHHLGFLV